MALMKVHYNDMCVIDQGNAVVFLLLDLSQAFDVIDHDLMLCRLHHYLGILNTALGWVKICGS